MFRTIIVAAAATATLAGGAGLALAATGPHAATTEHFQLMNTSPTSNQSGVIASGVFTAAGTDVPGTGNTDTVTFPGGAFKLTHKMTSQHQHFNPKTCLLSFSGTATYTIHNGTGAYQGISGSGTATVSVLAIAARNSQGACSQAKAPVAMQQIIKASGPLTLP